MQNDGEINGDSSSEECLFTVECESISLSQISRMLDNKRHHVRAVLAKFQCFSECCIPHRVVFAMDDGDMSLSSISPGKRT